MRVERLMFPTLFSTYTYEAHYNHYRPTHRKDHQIMSFLNRMQSRPLPVVPLDELQRQIDAGLPPEGMMTAEELARPNEVAINGKSALLHIAESLTKNIQAAERQHGQSLQEVVDAQASSMSKLALAFDAYKKECESAAQIVVAATQQLDAAIKAHIEDSIDTSQMVSKLRDVRIKNPLLDKGNTITRRANLPRSRSGKR